MYESFFGLRERPFDLSPNPRFLVMTSAHREALSNLEYAMASGKGLALMLGDAGTGKTTIIRTALARHKGRVHFVHLNNSVLSRAEFVEMLAARFDLSPAARTSKTAMLLELEALLEARKARGEATVLVADEAQSLPLDLLEEIRLLANIETDEAKSMTLIIAGQPELTERLNEPALRQLKQRVALRCELRMLDMKETAGYIAGRLRAAGGTGAQVFTRDAVQLIHEASRGIPRTINVLADNALLSAFATGERPVTRRTVVEVSRDFGYGSAELDDEHAAEDAAGGSSGVSGPAVEAPSATARANAPAAVRATGSATTASAATGSATTGPATTAPTTTPAATSAATSPSAANMPAASASATAAPSLQAASLPAPSRTVSSSATDATPSTSEAEAAPARPGRLLGGEPTGDAAHGTVPEPEVAEAQPKRRFFAFFGGRKQR